jgi:hypothetical protein
MRYTALFVACLAVTTMATTHLDAIFEDVSKTEFGQTIVESIQLQLESGATVDTLIESMRDVRDGLRGQLSDADNAHQDADKLCAVDLSEYAAGMSGEAANIAKMEGMAAFDASTLTSRQEESQNKQKELADREAMAESMANARSAEEERWHAVQAEHRLVQGMIEDVRAIVVGRLQQSEGAFLESKTNSMASAVSKLRSFKPSGEAGLSHGYGALFTLLAQMLEKNPNAHGDQVVV